MRWGLIALSAAALFGCVQCRYAAQNVGSATPPHVNLPRADPPVLLKQQRTAMGTQVALTLWAPDTLSTHQAIDAAYDEMHRLEILMTSWEHPGWPQSDVMRINLGAGTPADVPVSPETFEVLALAQKMALASFGAFDITYAPLRDLWHFDEDATSVVPDADAIAARLAYVGFADLALNPAALTARLGRSGMKIDLGGIAKGAIVDAAVQTLRDRGLRDFILQAGGDMYVSGDRAGQPWRVGIQDPRRGEEHFATLALRDHAFSTAGDYERGFVRDEQRYHHILDAKTGYPATASRSVTVYAPTALLADTLDNAVFILGPKAGITLLQQYPDCEAVIVDADNRVWVTDGLQKRVDYRSPTP